MFGYFDLEEVRARASEITAALEDLLSRPSFAQRRRSRQWLFLRTCFSDLLGISAAGTPFSQLQSAQYKFEVEDRLRRLYLNSGKALPFVFRLEHKRRAKTLMLVDDSYPDTNGYVLLVANSRPESVVPSQTTALRELLVRIVHDAAQAELQVYRSLPDVDLGPLEGTFRHDGPAYAQIRNIAEQHHRKRKTISFPAHNPSTMTIRKANVVSVSEDSAVVRTQEYWYLRWWSFILNEYEHVYNETNYHQRSLVWIDGRWLIDSDTYPPPRSIALRRRRSS